MNRCLHALFLSAALAASSNPAVSQTDNPFANVTFTTVHSFQGALDGGNPGYGALILDPAGNFYGTTIDGGGQVTGGCESDGCGTVFKLDPQGNLTTLHRFGSVTYDAAGPYGTLLRDSAGNLYGTSWGGGTSGNACYGYGCGTVWMLSVAGKEHVVYNFAGGTRDGSVATAGLTLGTDGRVYSTTHNGGIVEAGVVFAIDKSGAESIIHFFQPFSDDGDNTWSGLVRDPSGNFYGMTLAGGGTNPNCGGEFGCGVIYEITETGTETILYHFTGLADGLWPYGGLLRDEKGNLYGTSQGGTGQYGTVFKLDPSGKFTVLHTFTGGTNGADPLTALVRDAAGNLYGTTAHGGEFGAKCAGGFGCGTVFALTPSGNFYVLHNFTGEGDGWDPVAPLTFDSSGNLYGTTSNGGAYDDGAIFKISR
jgi:uncharacterized repeat protein (TIGR03803 family)